MITTGYELLFISNLALFGGYLLDKTVAFTMGFPLGSRIASGREVLTPTSITLPRDVDYWTFRNNGKPFQSKDWVRLKRIADGNPNEQAIGAFGVGFYSLFSITDEPFVQSGNEWMGFYWRKGSEQLIARRGYIPPHLQDSEWTSFEMPLREPTPLPGSPLDIARFLATSLTFMVHLQSVSLYFDGKYLAQIEKTTGIPRKLDIPSGLKLTSPSGLMSTTRITSTSLYMKATLPRWTQSTAEISNSSKIDQSITSGPVGSRPVFPLKTILETSDASKRSCSWHAVKTVESVIQLLVFTAEFSVHLDNKLGAELERATKKKPPHASTYQLLFMGKDESDANKRDGAKGSEVSKSVFDGLQADIERAGHARVFIGHATSQTTGIGGHASAQFIPTVERESIDFINRDISSWNKELLYIGGLLARAVYEIELTYINELWPSIMNGTTTYWTNESDADNLLRLWLQNRSLHALQFFTVYPTKPSAVVETEFQAAFFDSGPIPNHPFPIISTLGVRSVAEVRNFNPRLVGLLKNTPMLLPEISTSNPLMLAAIQKRGMCMDISIQDVFKELIDRILDEQEVIVLLQWLAGLNCSRPNTGIQDLKEIYSRTKFFDLGKEGSRRNVISLISIKTFISHHPAIIPVDSPLPGHTLPPTISISLENLELDKLFGWTKLSVPDWISYLTCPEVQGNRNTDIGLNPRFAETVLGVIARAWPSMNQRDQKRIHLMLSNVSCIPTTAGLKIPKEVYLLSTHEFPNLSVLAMPSGTPVRGTFEKVMVALGVKQHVELEIVFSRITQDPNWTTAKLIKYLVDVQSSLSSDEKDLLKQSKLFTREGDKSQGGILFYSASELYEPIDILRNMGLPLLAWDSSVRWKPGSAANFLFELGLKRFPPLQVILPLIGTADLNKRRIVIEYFMKNYNAFYKHYRADFFKRLRFVPAIKGDGSALLSDPTMVYSNPKCASMGFNIVDPSLDQDLIFKLQIRKDPLVDALLVVLADSPPRNHDLARKSYEYLASRIGDFTVAQLTYIAITAFVPVQVHSHCISKDQDHSVQRMFKPSEVYFGNMEIQNDPCSGFFTYIDFGADAAKFLKVAGVKDQPNSSQICQAIISDPKRFKDAVGGYEHYLNYLKRIGTQIDLFRPEVIQKMRQSCMLVGKRKSSELSKGNTEESGEMGASDKKTDGDVQFELLTPEEVVIVDDIHTYAIFGHAVWSAPQEDDIETLYKTLGSRRLSSLVSRDYKITPSDKHKHSNKAEDIRLLLLERLPIFLQGYTDKDIYLTPEWLCRDSNLRVNMAHQIQLTRHLEDTLNPPVSQELSATAERDAARDTVTLWLSEELEIDSFEIANALCSVLLACPKINDSMLFTTILSADVKALRRRGLGVDSSYTRGKVEYAQPKLTRPRVENKSRDSGETELHAASSVPKPTDLTSITLQAGRTSPEPSTPAIDSVPQTNPNDNTEEVLPTLYSWSFPGAFGSTSNLNWINPAEPWWLGKTSPPHQEPLTSDQTAAHEPKYNVSLGIPPFLLARGGPSGSGPQPEFAWSLQSWFMYCSRRQIVMVMEPLEQGYCRFGDSIESFFFSGLVDGYRIYTTQDTLHPKQLLAQISDSVTRFGSLIVAPLRTVYGLLPSSVHIVYSNKAGLISLSHYDSCSLFLNFKYYKDWHERGDLQKTLTFWYFALAREIADNLRGPYTYSRDHEYEYSVRVLLEHHFSEFSALLARVKTTAQ
ncbi:protein-histidine kinase [Rhizoctonia solani]|uniref:Protein-histidine kinase n=1 Tax=Rhizoctonia solani TaxID=456999 RepID=A0A8H8PA73_9AGAM|nr:protein-histidine kinase [Rhizoctonia solani]QRW26603.1 protein-histidine kinase [Rhizoctonia solani]